MRCFVRRRKRAFSSFSSSLMQTSTKAFKASSPKRCSWATSNPPAKPFTPATPKSFTSQASPSRTWTPASPSALRIVLPFGPRRVPHRVRLIAGPVFRFEFTCVEIPLHVGLVKVLLPGEERAAADLVCAGSLVLSPPQSIEQLVHHPARHLVLVAG